MGLDHFVVSLVINSGAKCKPKAYFKFEPMWFTDSTFLSLLEEWWRSSPFIPGSRMYQLAKTLVHLKKCINAWNISTFSNIFKEKGIAKELEEWNEVIIT